MAKAQAAFNQANGRRADELTLTEALLAQMGKGAENMCAIRSRLVALERLLGAAANH